jgi:Tfp pilus assembly protein PilF/uncharacterized caspase-like protein
MKYLLTTCCLLFCALTLAQDLRPNRKKGNTFALVVGISDYQDANIRDLRYAHIDAKVFASFLLSKAGGSLDSQQIRLLTNEQATLAGLQAGFSWLSKKAKKGDRAIVYFSGHGDVETINAHEKGYLLAYDTPKNNYRLNAVDLNDFNEHLIATLSKEGVQLIIITDACHSGTLAGGTGGKEATASQLMKRYANEVKIMSCQPYEESQESSKWGNGRGVFSYYLIDGLKGRADEDRDQTVDLFELEVFLQERIRNATNKKQHPDVFGGRKEASIFTVDDATAASMKAAEKQEIQQAFETDVLEKLASEQAYMQYEQFKVALKGGDLLFPEGRSAAFFYDALYADTSFKPYVGLVAEHLTTALMDSVQQALNAYLNTDPQELTQRLHFDQKYARFPKYLNKVADIFTDKDVRYRETRAKQCYFEGLSLRLRAEQSGGNDSLYRLALVQQHNALKLEDRAAYIHNEIGWLLLEQDSIDAGIRHLQKAVAISPQWAIPYNNLGVAYDEMDSLEQAKLYYRHAIQLKPDFGSVYANLIDLYDRLTLPDSAELMYHKAIAINPAEKTAHYNYGVLRCKQEGRKPEAEAAYLEALRLDPHYAKAYYALGLLYTDMANPNGAKASFLKALELEAGNFEIASQLAQVLINLNQVDQIPALALDTLSTLLILYGVMNAYVQSDNNNQIPGIYAVAIAINPSEPYTDFLFCTYLADRGMEKEALAHVEKTLQKAQKTGESNDYFDLLMEEQMLDSLRNSNQFREIMHQFFPDRQE